MTFTRPNILSKIYDSLDDIRSKIQFGFKKGISIQYFFIAVTGGILVKVVHVILY